MSGPRVFVVQSPDKHDPVTGEAVGKVFDFSAAKKFGEVVVLIDGELRPDNVEEVRRLLWSRLSYFNHWDYLVLTGNPIIMSLATVVAAELTDGNLRFLQWRGRGGYQVIHYKDFFLD